MAALPALPAFCAKCNDTVQLATRITPKGPGKTGNPRKPAVGYADSCPVCNSGILVVRCLRCQKHVQPEKAVVNAQEREKGKCLIECVCPLCQGDVCCFKAVEWYNKLDAAARSALEPAPSVAR